MTDIVERLRMAERYGNVSAKEAADEIERLRAALREIADAYAGDDGDENAVWMRETARKALDGKDG